MHFFTANPAGRDVVDFPNRWDLLILPGVLAALFSLAWGMHQMTAPYDLGQQLPVSLEPSNLPAYAMRTTLRMAAAMLFSILFTFIYASLAAKSRRAGMVLIPLLDVLQSVPILGFLSITIMGFIHLFPGSLMGPEAAAIFAIFTSQAWNMAFSFYYSLRMIPTDLYQVADVFQLSAWQRFWKLEVPFAMPNLVWNAMMSVSGGWFFVVASEAISVSGQTIMLPGIGSFIALAIQHKDLSAIGYAIFTMFIVILLYDQLIFRPLIAWSDKFKFELSESQDVPSSWVLTLMQRTRLLPKLLALPAIFWEISLKVFRHIPARPLPKFKLKILNRNVRLLDKVWLALLLVLSIIGLLTLSHFVLSEVSYSEIGNVFFLGLLTAGRVIVLIILATLFWVPIGVWIGMRPKWAQRAQPVVLFLAAFPANLMFPLAVVLIVTYHLNVEIWLSPLMILGTQWYILFNVIAGAAAIPNDMREAAANLGLKKLLVWRRMILPAIFPSYITGGLTASGGAWNASVVSELVSWGNTTLVASGIGAYITQQTMNGDHPRIALGIGVMSLYVIILNRVVWKRLYRFAQDRLKLE
ncbi:ABC transporter permease [Sulfurirhabdus autotrophica]|uniref:NitT/TauT family transport system permease protein n=1 Tax=Sulfurirhabdus autotrophica TaxID=1706046 RepID=A0A4R3Y2N3_9PROT|nr:ABC transporter permease subunit [Sulfurirhabdus autotrophica]TCV86425.1 NitT/TauT family transport system permease protein [Sulfurirhabdus autotrophica]